MQSSSMRCMDTVRGRCKVQVCDAWIVRKPFGARIYPYKIHSLAESVSTSAKLFVPMNMIGGSQMHPQQRSIAHIWQKSTLTGQSEQWFIKLFFLKTNSISFNKEHNSLESIKIILWTQLYSFSLIRRKI
ncbi:hypothetical protein SFRURICE_018636 [Spodoptera frugiperda]|nr:hypothetical protein SFRURICE_018636 [Spodoptera frugiperda]